MYNLNMVIVVIQGLNYAKKFQKNYDGKMLNLVWAIFFLSNKKTLSIKQIVQITFPGVRGQYVLILQSVIWINELDVCSFSLQLEVPYKSWECIQTIQQLVCESPKEKESVWKKL